ncbi:MAG: pyroglutamyl-peptidase I [Gemmataceae bacterium]
MTRVLLTSFEPFGGMSRNSSHEAAAELLRAPPPGVELDWLPLPVVAPDCADRAWDRYSRLRHDGLLCLGQAGGCAALHLERRGLNRDRFDAPDNAGNVRRGPVVRGGPAHLDSPFPIDAALAALHAAGVPAEPSLSAGEYVCNHHYYSLLHRAATPGGPWVLFVHLPFAPGQGTPALDAALMAEGLRLLLRVSRDAG